MEVTLEKSSREKGERRQWLELKEGTWEDSSLQQVMCDLQRMPHGFEMMLTTFIM